MRGNVGVYLIDIVLQRRDVDRARNPACGAVGAGVDKLPATAAEAAELRTGRVAGGVGLSEAESPVGGDVNLLAAGNFDVL